ncbi:MAG: hypothetical protein AAF226_00235 [Verrucomicrobiota bacterium]
MKFLLKYKLITVFLGLILFGVLRTPFEEHSRTELESAGFLLPTPGANALDQMSQSTLMGTLGGLRSLVATYLVLEAYTHFSNQEWDENKKDLVAVTHLEPNDETHWVSLIWNRGINATADMETRENLPKFERDRLFNEYALDAIELGKKGLIQVPDSIPLRIQIAEVYREKLKDYCGAAEMYRQMLGQPREPAYAERFYGYFLAECGEHTKAYQWLLRLYMEGDHQHTPSLLKYIEDLEQLLEIPTPSRISKRQPKTHPKMERQKRDQRLKNGTLLPGGIIIP